VGTHAAQQDGPAGEFLVCIPSGGAEACPWHTDRVSSITSQLHSGIRADPWHGRDETCWPGAGGV